MLGGMSNSIAEVVGSNPTGPFFTTKKLRHYFEFDFSECRTKSLAMPMQYPSLSRGTYHMDACEMKVLSI